jgi:hypothetical protein
VLRNRATRRRGIHRARNRATRQALKEAIRLSNQVTRQGLREAIRLSNKVILSKVIRHKDLRALTRQDRSKVTRQDHSKDIRQDHNKVIRQGLRNKDIRQDRSRVILSKAILPNRILPSLRHEMFPTETTPAIRRLGRRLRNLSSINASGIPFLFYLQCGCGWISALFRTRREKANRCVIPSPEPSHPSEWTRQFVADVCQRRSKSCAKAVSPSF